MADLQFIAAIVNSLAWPTAAVLAAGLPRKQIAAVIPRMESFEFRGAKATFAALLTGWPQTSRTAGRRWHANGPGVMTND